MKIARSRLKQIIQEELRRALNENYSLTAHKMEDEMAYEGQRGNDERGQHDNDSDPEDPLAEDDAYEGYMDEELMDGDYMEEDYMDEEYDEGYMMEEGEDEGEEHSPHHMAEVSRRLRNRRRGV